MHAHNIDDWFVTKAKLIRGGRLNAYERLDPAKTALVVVDMQNYFVQDGMPYNRRADREGHRAQHQSTGAGDAGCSRPRHMDPDRGAER